MDIRPPGARNRKISLDTGFQTPLSELFKSLVFNDVMLPTLFDFIHMKSTAIS